MKTSWMGMEGTLKEAMIKSDGFNTRAVNPLTAR